jgi:glutaconate CoA-transferase subunit B
VDATGWAVKFAASVAETPPPTDIELKELRALQARTAAAHGAAA